MYEARQRKEKVSRRIDRGNGIRRRNINNCVFCSHQKRTLQCQASIDSTGIPHITNRSIYLDNNLSSQYKKVFGGTPGFAQNYGYLDNYEYNSCGNGHTEPNLISRKYQGTFGDWNVANRAVDIANKNNRASFELYTELEPCNDCKSQLYDNRYIPNDVVHWTFPYDTNCITNLTCSELHKQKAQQLLSQNDKVIRWDMEKYGGYQTPKLVAYIQPQSSDEQNTFLSDSDISSDTEKYIEQIEKKLLSSVTFD